MSRASMMAIAEANSAAQRAQEAYITACHGVADAVADRVKERLQQIRRRRPRHVIKFISGMGTWTLIIRSAKCSDLLGVGHTRDSAIDAVMQSALDTFGWEAVPTGDLKAVDDNVVGDLS